MWWWNTWNLCVLSRCLHPGHCTVFNQMLTFKVEAPNSVGDPILTPIFASFIDDNYALIGEHLSAIIVVLLEFLVCERSLFSSYCIAYNLNLWKLVLSLIFFMMSNLLFDLVHCFVWLAWVTIRSSIFSLTLSFSAMFYHFLWSAC